MADKRPVRPTSSGPDVVVETLTELINLTDVLAGRRVGFPADTAVLLRLLSHSWVGRLESTSQLHASA